MLDKELINKYNLIKTPEELLEFMDNNINYGYLGKNNKVYYFGDVDFDKDWYNEYILESKDDILKTGIGNCFDQTELERCWFLENDYEQYRDHWIEYAMLEFMKYDMSEKYIELALDNYLKNRTIINSKTSFGPTRLELLLSTYKLYNYVKIPLFARFYYISNWTYNADGTWTAAAWRRRSVTSPSSRTAGS